MERKERQNEGALRVASVGGVGWAAVGGVHGWHGWVGSVGREVVGGMRGQGV